MRQKTKAQDNMNNDDIIVETVEEEEETDMAAMDYEQLMSYFESLKESSAWLIFTLYDARDVWTLFRLATEGFHSSIHSIATFCIAVGWFRNWIWHPEIDV